VLAEIRQRVLDRVPRLRGRRDHLDVIAIREHLAAARPSAVAERSVDVTRRRDRKALHPAGERGLVLGLDDQVHVVALQRDVDDTEPLTQRSRDRGIVHRLVHPAAPQAAHRRSDPHHHVQRVIRLEVRPRPVPLARPWPLRLATSAAALATPTEQRLLHMPPSHGRTIRIVVLIGN
jgi:hypothetical protein